MTGGSTVARMGTTYGSVPTCWSCWFGRNPDRLPVRVPAAPLRQCGYCGRTTGAGIARRDAWANALHATVVDGDAVWRCAYGATDAEHPDACPREGCACALDAMLDGMAGRMIEGG